MDDARPGRAASPRRRQRAGAWTDFPAHAAHRLVNRLRHWRRGNTRRGSRRNIVSHYDLGNDFFPLWLDPTMLYSSAIWDENSAATLEQAQQHQLARIVALLDLRGGESILEIGCGWGALALRLAAGGRTARHSA